MGNNWEIWSDNLIEADWFKNLDVRMDSGATYTIGRRNSNPVHIENLIAYDRPDIILCDSGKPILVVEKTAEVPTGHNVGQRVARLVRSAEYGLTTLYFLPFEARKHGKYSSMCNINPRLLRAMLKMGEIHNCSVLPVNWPCDEYGELISDGSEDTVMSELMRDALDSYEATGIVVLDDCHETSLRLEINEREASFPPYRELPKSAEVLATRHFLKDKQLTDEAREHLQLRPESLVYTMDMSPEKSGRQDPYTGMQFIYDYGWLRTGPRPADRDLNLILNIPRVDLKTWTQKNPEDYGSKSCNWYLTADAIVLSDGIIHLTDWPLHHVD
jgi:hypothetical protein